MQPWVIIEGKTFFFFADLLCKAGARGVAVLVLLRRALVLVIAPQMCVCGRAHTHPSLPVCPSMVGDDVGSCWGAVVVVCWVAFMWCACCRCWGGRGLNPPPPPFLWKLDKIALV